MAEDTPSKELVGDSEKDVVKDDAEDQDKTSVRKKSRLSVKTPSSTNITSEAKVRRLSDQPGRKISSIELDPLTLMPRGFLYKTRCIAKYHAEQYDEICLNIGDIIYVVRYDDPEDVKCGWVYGFKEGTTEKGLLPKNHTQVIPDESEECSNRQNYSSATNSSSKSSSKK